jgi:transcriptional regulator with XRE-family HTH domain
MNGQIRDGRADMTTNIARLVQERGWNQEDFARHTGLNRQTVRQILRAGAEHRPRNATVSACAKALGLTVSELRDLPFEGLLARMNGVSADIDPALRRRYDEATQPYFGAWAKRNPERAGRLTPEQVDEILSIQGTGGPLSRDDIEHFIELVERKRQLIGKIHAIAGTEYVDLLERLVELLFEKVQPYPDRR